MQYMLNKYVSEMNGGVVVNRKWEISKWKRQDIIGLRLSKSANEETMAYHKLGDVMSN